MTLPTPVASAKHSDANSRSKSCTDGNSLRIASSAAATPAPFFGGAISVTRSSSSRDLRCGGRSDNLPAMALTCRFIGTSIP